MTREISLQRGERRSGDRLHLIRLDETGAGSAEEGEECVVVDPSTDEERLGRIVTVERKRLDQLSEEDAAKVLAPPENNFQSLRMKLDQYRFRPQWEQGSTRFRIIEIELIGEPAAHE